MFQIFDIFSNSEGVVIFSRSFQTLEECFDCIKEQLQYLIRDKECMFKPYNTENPQEYIKKAEKLIKEMSNMQSYEDGSSLENITADYDKMFGCHRICFTFNICNGDEYYSYIIKEEIKNHDQWEQLI